MNIENNNQLYNKFLQTIIDLKLIQDFQNQNGYLAVSVLKLIIIKILVNWENGT